MALIHIRACTLQQKIFMIVWCRYHLMFCCRSLIVNWCILWLIIM